MIYIVIYWAISMIIFERGRKGDKYILYVNKIYFSFEPVLFLYKTGKPRAPPEIRIILLFTAVTMNRKICARWNAGTSSAPAAAAIKFLGSDTNRASTDAVGMILTFVSFP